jgi:hypothetical protein
MQIFKELSENSKFLKNSKVLRNCKNKIDRKYLGLNNISIVMGISVRNTR